MTFFQGLYKVLISPLELLLETVFSFSYRIVGSLGISIIILSLVMNFLLLPLYNRADKIQEEENEIQKKMKKWSDHINKTFKGDERYMMQQTYYRQNNYKPIYAIRGLIPLLLEIPFFMAAYNYLSNLQMLQGASFGPILDLGTPDGMLNIFGVSINVLPILMTIINIVSSLIYTKDAPLKTKIQLYAMALVFLVLLYDSPSGLALYWTLNNLFSLIKNIILKYDKEKKILTYGASLCGVLLITVSFVVPLSSLIKRLFVMMIGLVLNVPLLIKLFGKKGKKININLDFIKHNKTYFFINNIALILLIGLYIPSTFLSASPEELIGEWALISPNTYLINSLLLAIGVFGVWTTVFYFLSDEKTRKIIYFALSLYLAAGIVNFFLFGTKLGKISRLLVYDDGLIFSSLEKILNLLMIVIIFSVLIYLIYKKNIKLYKITCVLCLAFLIMSIVNIANTEKVSAKAIAIVEEQKENVSDDIIRLSETEKNVVIIMLDRAIGSYLPYLFNEHNELLDKYTGFTYYPNTTSYGAFTNVGTPGLFGGYDYTPEKMNKRDEELLVDKHNEALKVMPKLFYDQDYEVTFCDPSYAGYEWIPDLSIFGEFEGMRTYITSRMFVPKDTTSITNANDSLYRNLFCFSVMKTAPVVLQPALYGYGFYNCVDAEYGKQVDCQVAETISKTTGLNRTALYAYGTLERFVDFTKVTDSNKGTLTIITNDATHEPNILEEPDYRLSLNIDNTNYDNEHRIRKSILGDEMEITEYEQMSHYQTNGFALVKIGEWIDYLKEMGVYDNTRIIICSDHGRGLGQFSNMLFADEAFGDAMWYNSLLLVKDFNETEFRVNDDFMTTCDIPYLASKDLGFETVNPYSGNSLKPNSNEKDIVNCFHTNWDVEANNGYRYEDGEWYSVHDNIFIKNNWAKIEDPSK